MSSPLTQKPARLCVLVSGRGTNLRALAAAIDSGACPAQLCCVLSDRDDSPALAFAQERGVATQVVRAKDFTERVSWDKALSNALRAHTPDLIVVAGFMRLLGPSVLNHFKNRIINVHPSLLPSFPGVDAPQQALAKGVTLSGCTVHVVDEGVDTGTILAQAAVPVLRSDDAQTLHARIQTAEHALLPAVVAAIAKGVIDLDAPPRQSISSTDVLDASEGALVWPRLAD